MARRSASGSSESSRTRVGNSALGEAAHEHAVEVEPEAERHVAHEHAVAEPADAAEVGVELELERAAEHVHAGRGLDRVEAGEPVQRGFDLVGRLRSASGHVGPAGLAAPRWSRTRPSAQAASSRQPGGGVDREVVDQRGDEGLQLARVAASSRSKCSGRGSRSVTARSAAELVLQRCAA